MFENSFQACSRNKGKNMDIIRALQEELGIGRGQVEAPAANVSWVVVISWVTVFSLSRPVQAVSRTADIPNIQGSRNKCFFIMNSFLIFPFVKLIL